MKKLIFLNGPPRSGKDTIANIIVSNYNAVNLKFAQPLRDAVCGLLNISESEFDSMKNTDLSFNYRIRDLTIDLAEIIIKPNLGETWFSNKLIERVKFIFSNKEYIIISDLGFLVEFENVYLNLKDTYDCQIWKIYRSGTTFRLDSRNYVTYDGVKNIAIVNDFNIDILTKTIVNKL